MREDMEKRNKDKEATPNVIDGRSAATSTFGRKWNFLQDEEVRNDGSEFTVARPTQSAGMTSKVHFETLDQDKIY